MDRAVENCIKLLSHLLRELRICKIQSGYSVLGHPVPVGTLTEVSKLGSQNKGNRVSMVT